MDLGLEEPSSRLLTGWHLRITPHPGASRSIPALSTPACRGWGQGRGIGQLPGVTLHPLFCLLLSL